MNIQLFGQDWPPLYGKSKFFKIKKEKALKKIAKFEARLSIEKAIVKECDIQIKKIDEVNKNEDKK